MGKYENINREIALKAYMQGQAGEALSEMLGDYQEEVTLEGEQDYAAQIRELLADQLDFGAITERWEKTFAQPAMEAWWKYNAPGVRDEFAGVPGAFYSADRARGVASQSSQYAGNIAQTLYGSLEAAAGRAPGIIGMLGNLSPASVYGNWAAPQLDIAQTIMSQDNIQMTDQTKMIARKKRQGAVWGMVGGAIGSYFGGPAGGMVGSKIGETQGGGGYNVEGGS